MVLVVSAVEIMLLGLLLFWKMKKSQPARFCIHYFRHPPPNLVGVFLINK